MKTALILIAAAATMWATASFLTGFDGDFVGAAIIALLALGAAFFIDHMDELGRERMARGRAAVWERRDAEAAERQQLFDEIDDYLGEH